MEKQYLAVYKDNPIQAQAILQNSAGRLRPRHLGQMSFAHFCSLS